MTKDEFKKVLTDAIGGSAYGDEVIADLVANFGEEGKYAQNAKDRLDDRLGTLKGWEKKHREEGDAAKADEEAAKIAIVEKALKAIA
ncbi:FRAT-87 protein [Dubosiella newyorkensis]|jgi:hypothetical protein|uniref:Uncharacterized protein n=9 Tax=Dubosiella newyorkensis TaxID=1862672 RepID=A0A1U7NP27_9FIRM|nr:FRAT-87 protein [Dubosiella newyorkensis]MCI9041129.1 hypothetical protein [Dubosiella newyorkensis]OLU43873.1 hypothetical protein BO225_11435 [Dubosiella newyorkensis]OLU47242.1 hypothetical protein BO225_03330 [Dubosiella newyorkensis]